MAQSFEAYQTLREFKTGGVIAVMLSPIFTRYKYTGEEALALLQQIHQALAENKEEYEGGMMAALAELYGQPEGTTLLFDELMAALLRLAPQRSSIMHVIGSVDTFVRAEGKTDLAVPFRESLASVFKGFVEQKNNEQSAMAELAKTLRATSERGEGTDAPVADPTTTVEQEEGEE